MLIIEPADNMIIPIYLYKYPIIDIISLIFILSLFWMGLNRKILIQLPIPNSARLRYPRIFPMVPVSPMKSAPRLSKKIFLEKNARMSERK